MSKIATATVPAEQFVLARTLQAFPDVAFRMVRLVVDSSDQMRPLLWAGSAETDRLRAMLDTDPSVDSVDILGAFDGGCLLWLDWRPSSQQFDAVLGWDGVTLLDAIGYDDGWQLQVFLMDGYTTTQEWCVDADADIAIERVDTLSETADHGCFGLTERQYETVVTAYEAGYYEIPREITQDDLATQFGVSHQAISERLRRAHETLIVNSLYYKLYRREQTISPQIRYEPPA